MRWDGYSIFVFCFLLPRELMALARRLIALAALAPVLSWRAPPVAGRNQWGGAAAARRACDRWSTGCARVPTRPPGCAAAARGDGAPGPPPFTATGNLPDGSAVFIQEVPPGWADMLGGGAGDNAGAAAAKLLRESLDTDPYWPYASVDQAQLALRDHACYLVSSSRGEEAGGLGGDALGLFLLGPAFPGRSGHVGHCLLVTQAAHRGRGVGAVMGRLLLGAGGQQGLAAQLGYDSLMAPLVYVSNAAGVALCRSLKFRLLCVVPRAGRLADGASNTDAMCFYYALPRAPRASNRSRRRTASGGARALGEGARGVLEAGSTAAAGGEKGGQEEEKMDTLARSSVAREDAMWMEKALELAAMAAKDGEVGAPEEVQDAAGCRQTYYLLGRRGGIT